MATQAISAENTLEADAVSRLALRFPRVWAALISILVQGGERERL